MVVSMQSLHLTAKLPSTAQGEILNVTSAKMEFTFAYILGESGDHPTHGRSIQPSIGFSQLRELTNISKTLMLCQRQNQ
jgi:hypothetical protein